jgi:hypothetical protein
MHNFLVELAYHFVIHKFERESRKKQSLDRWLIEILIESFFTYFNKLRINERTLKTKYDRSGLVIPACFPD